MNRSLRKEMDLAEMQDKLAHFMKKAAEMEVLAERRHLLIQELYGMVHESVEIALRCKTRLIDQESDETEAMQARFNRLMEKVQIAGRPNGGTILVERALNGGRTPNPLSIKPPRVPIYAPKPKPRPLTRSELTSEEKPQEAPSAPAESNE